MGHEMWVRVHVRVCECGEEGERSILYETGK